MTPPIPSPAPLGFEGAKLVQEAGDLPAAEEAYRQLLRRQPKDARVWFALGTLCEQGNREAEAIANYRQAIELDASHSEWHLKLGNVLLPLGRYEEAEAAYRACLERAPAEVTALVNLGFTLSELERHEEAKGCYEKARMIAPGVPEVHHNLANLLREQGQFEAAMAGYDEALRLRPDYGKAHINRGVALVARGRLEEAERDLRRGAELQPDFAEAHSSLGTALSALGNIDGAEAAYETAIRLKPDFADAHWNQALVRLLRGDFARGWPEYEWRWKCKKAFQIPPINRPRWDGEPVDGRTVLLYAEQGLGDTLHFVRYAAIVKERGAKVVLQCQGTLIPLLKRTPGIDQFAAWGDPLPQCDLWAPLMSLPAILKTTLETIPAAGPYLFAEPALVDHWRRVTAPMAGFTVGIAWQGSPRHPWDRHRSVPLSTFAPLARLPGVRLVSLQRTLTDADHAAGVPLVAFGELLDRVSGPFMDTAALMKSLDLIITIDTSIAHLAGGLGVPVWIVLHHTPDWRWLRERADSPWYPAARLFRQRRPGEWGPVFEQLAEELSRLAGQKKQPLLVEVSAGELLDKLTILQIKLVRITDPAKLQHVRTEFDALSTVRAGLPISPELVERERDLQRINEQLWEVEDALRELEHLQQFGTEFVRLARSVYQLNDRRAEVKKQINQLLGSRLMEEKSYSR